MDYNYVNNGFNASVPLHAFCAWFNDNFDQVHDGSFNALNKYSVTNTAANDAFILPDKYDKQIQHFINTFGTRQRDWIQSLIQYINNPNHLKRYKKLK